MRVVSWNVRRAGGSRGAALIAALRVHEPDVAVLIDVPVRRVELLQDLQAAGFAWFGHADSSDGAGRVLIASRLEATESLPEPEIELKDRWAEVTIPRRNLVIAGVYVPVTGNQPAQKRRMWRAIHEAAASRSEDAYLIMGDFNTGDIPLDKSHPSRPFRFTSEYRALTKIGFTEAWRHLNPSVQEFSWFRSDGRGFRIDHAFISPVLRTRLKACRYSHHERETRISDHSVLILDLD